ncbi:MAG TPA: ATP-binding protein, partial [Mycobacterium sp.]|nr:ATP-binding protein [Mycobacterium sp.]
SGLLQRALVNLIGNALHYAPDSPIRIDAGQVADRVLIDVINQGPGVPRRTAEHIFQPNEQPGDPDATSGVGLGLMVARGFIDAMGGTIQAGDTPGGGLTITIDLPAPPRTDRS